MAYAGTATAVANVAETATAIPLADERMDRPFVGRSVRRHFRILFPDPEACQWQRKVRHRPRAFDITSGRSSATGTPTGSLRAGPISRRYEEPQPQGGAQTTTSASTLTFRQRLCSTVTSRRCGKGKRSRTGHSEPAERSTASPQIVRKSSANDRLEPSSATNGSSAQVEGMFAGQRLGVTPCSGSQPPPRR